MAVGEKISRMEKIRIKYFTDKSKSLHISMANPTGLIIVVRRSRNESRRITKLIPLGVAMELPKGYEAHIMPRSSSYKNFEIMRQTAAES